MLNQNESPINAEVIRPRVIYASSKNTQWLNKVNQAAQAEGCRVQTSPTITSMINQAATDQNVACIVVDYDPRVQQWDNIEQLLFDKKVTAPVVLVLDDSEGLSASEAVARIAHLVGFSSMEIHEVQDLIRNANGLKPLVEHQFEVLGCHRLYESLPERQRKIVDYVVEGAPNKQIATKLKVSVKTIERERQKAYRQLNVRSTAEMTRVVILGNLHDVIFPVPLPTSHPQGLRMDTQSSTMAPTTSRPTGVSTSWLQNLPG